MRENKRQKLSKKKESYEEKWVNYQILKLLELPSDIVNLSLNVLSVVMPNTIPPMSASSSSSLLFFVKMAEPNSILIVLD